MDQSTPDRLSFHTLFAFTFVRNIYFLYIYKPSFKSAPVQERRGTLNGPTTPERPSFHTLFAFTFVRNIYFLYIYNPSFKSAPRAREEGHPKWTNHP